jgi:hypothetical protein
LARPIVTGTSLTNRLPRHPPPTPPPRCNPFAHNVGHRPISVPARSRTQFVITVADAKQGQAMTTNVVELFLLLSFLSLYFYTYRIKVLQTRIAALSRMEAKIDLLLKQSGISFEPYENVPSNIVSR